MNTRNMLNHSQVGQGIGMSGRTNSMGSSGLGSPNRSSPSIICMPKQQPARQPFTINRQTDPAKRTTVEICGSSCPLHFLTQTFFKEKQIFVILPHLFVFLFSMQHVRVWYESQSGVWDEQLIIKQHLQWHRLVCLTPVGISRDHQMEVLFK